MLIDLQFRLSLLDVPQHLFGQMGDTDRMLETVVTRTREDEISTSELFQIAQTLELWRIDDL